MESRHRDTPDNLLSLLAIAIDALAIFGGFMLATWLRFHSGLIPILIPPADNLFQQYSIGAAVATILMLLIFRSQALFIRPQTGSFVDKIPRITKAIGLGVLGTAVLAFAAQNQADFARLVVAISFITISFVVLLERYILFRIEWNLARHSKQRNLVLILGTDHVAARLTETLRQEPMLRANVIGFVKTSTEPDDPKIPTTRILGHLDQLEQILAQYDIHDMILTDSSIPHNQTVQILLLCEHNLIGFKMVPDLFRIMTTSMDVQSLNDIPLLGISPWPLDQFWHRCLKRMEDIGGAIIGLLLSAPIIAIAALAIKRSSPGPLFYVQQRCGQGGQPFNLYKLRTMPVDAEAATGPVWTRPDDERRTPVGAFLRAHNLDELPQFWNVLKGNMSLVGPRPERPHFVEQFKGEIVKYMFRHVSKPGMTGWAQVNGLRGNTDLTERVKYDLYYLENWSLSFDFKILLKTLFANRNAY
jgi:exopolysaccharide biosynthesis polyprenyl glycosylphosphotransferase